VCPERRRGANDLERARQAIALDLTAAAELVALALHDEPGRAQVSEMGCAQLRRLPRRMERVAEADQRTDLQFVGDHAGDAPAHRLAADGQLPPGGDVGRQRRNHVAPRLQEHRLAIWRPALALAARRHVGELEPHDPNAGGRDLRREVVQER
jgi:hypothetical protein